MDKPVYKKHERNFQRRGLPKFEFEPSHEKFKEVAEAHPLRPFSSKVVHKVARLLRPKLDAQFFKF